MNNRPNRRKFLTTLSGVAMGATPIAQALATVPFISLPRLLPDTRFENVGQEKNTEQEQLDQVRSYFFGEKPNFKITPDQEEITELCRIAIRCCHNIGIEHPRDIGRYMLMGLYLGMYFYRDPQYRDLSATISNRQEDGSTRIYKTYQLLVDYYPRIAGDNGAFVTKAFILLTFYQINGDTADLATDANKLLDELAKLWPQKADMIRPVQKRYFDAALAEAQTAGFPAELDGRLFGFLGAFAGIGWYNDPQARWVRDILDMHKNDLPKDRFVLSLQEMQRYGVRKKLFG